MKNEIFGVLNGHAVGIILKELIRRAILEIRKWRVDFQTHQKVLEHGKVDIYTDADIFAEEVILRSLRECFPNLEIVSEEDKEKKYLNTNCTVYVTVDPLCGTGNFDKKASNGIATTISIVVNGKVISAYVGDVIAQEIFGYRPDSDKVHRIREFETYEVINPFVKNSDKGLKLLMRGMVYDFPDKIRLKLEKRITFESHVIDSGSLSLSAAKLWKGEVDALLLKPRWETPWDLMPILGICNKLGYIFVKASSGMRGKTFVFSDMEEYKPIITKEKFTRDEPVFVIHKSYLD